ncbi:MAG: class GN sortase [Woeseia sp.]
MHRLTSGRWIVACLFALGFWQLAEGTWIPAKAWLAQGLMQHAWQRTADGETNAKPWPWADTQPVARLSAQDGEVELIVLAGSSGRTLAFAPGHLSTSALPGDAGNSVIAGHRDTHFQFLKNIKAGDALNVLRSDGREVRFEVISIDVVDSRRGSIVLDTDIPMLTLITCYPFNTTVPGGPLRYVVTAAEST